ncbi:MAG: alpha/beta hydrolase [Acidimicrobiales bacterium]|nr:alpha/beta hydrolase [Acidimicrobiales bacterium]
MCVGFGTCDGRWHDLGVPETVEFNSASPWVALVADHWPGPKTPVVLAHGGGQTRHSWGQTAAAIADTGHAVYSLDQRGHGDSDWDPEGNYSFDHFGQDAVAVIDQLDQPVIWIGASLGGMAGMLAADDRADRMAALVLVDITAQPALGGVDRILSFMSTTSKTGFASLEEAADVVAAYQPGRVRTKNLEGLKKNLRLGDDGRWRWHWDPAFMNVRQDDDRLHEERHEKLVHAAKGLACPVLLIRGRKSDLVTDAEVDEFMATVPHARYVDVADAAHMVAGDVNDVFTAAVLEFVATLP